jgi:hypothetical protein
LKVTNDQPGVNFRPVTPGVSVCHWLNSLRLGSKNGSKMASALLMGMGRIQES